MGKDQKHSQCSWEKGVLVRQAWELGERSKAGAGHPRILRLMTGKYSHVSR